MKITRRKLRQLIAEAIEEAAENIIPGQENDPHHAVAHDHGETEQYFQFLDQHAPFIPLYLETDENKKKAMIAAKKMNLDFNKLIGISHSYQGRDEEGRMYSPDAEFRRKAGYENRRAALAAKVRKHDGGEKAMGKIGG